MRSRGSRLMHKFRKKDNISGGRNEEASLLDVNTADKPKPQEYRNFEDLARSWRQFKKELPSVQTLYCALPLRF